MPERARLRWRSGLTALALGLGGRGLCCGGRRDGVLRLRRDLRLACALCGGAKIPGDERLGIAGGLRLAENGALPAEIAQFAKVGQLAQVIGQRVAVDPLYRDWQAQSASQRCHAFDDGAGFAVLGHGGDEAAIELDAVEGKVAQLRQRTEPEAEIIEAQADTLILQAGQQGDDAGEIAVQAGLADFHFQPVAGEIFHLAQLQQLLREPGIAHLRR